MNIETMLLRGLFAACLTVCVLIFGAMLSATPSSMSPGTGGRVVSTLVTTPINCALPTNGVICPRKG